MTIMALKMFSKIKHLHSSSLISLDEEIQEQNLSTKNFNNNNNKRTHIYTRKFNFNSIFTVIFTLIIFTNLFNESSQKPINNNRKRTYCGSELSNVIREVCGGRYADPTKRFRRDTLRIVDLCCYKPCSRETMIEFCDVSITQPVNEENKPNHLIPQYSAQILSDIDSDSSEKSPRNLIVVQSSREFTIKHINSNSHTDNQSDGSHDNAAFHIRSKVKTNNKKKRVNKKKGHSCRCRKRKRRVKVSSKEVLCVPCNKICRNINKSPMKCKKISSRINAFEIGTVPSAESNPHLIHDISSRSYLDDTYIARSKH